MKKAIISTFLAGTLCFTLVGCNKNPDSGEGNNPGGGNNNTVTVTENTDPLTLVSEQVDRTAWQSAFTTGNNYSTKTVITADATQNGDTMSTVITLKYKVEDDDMYYAMTMTRGGKTMMEAEAYIEVEEEGISLWARTKENGTWSKWDGETYEADMLDELLAIKGDLSFFKDNYANFSYSDTDKGYAATTSGLTAMKTELDAFMQSMMSQFGDSVPFTLDKLVVKVNNNKLSAYILDATLTAADESEENTPVPQDEDSNQEGSENDGETPDGGVENGGTDGDSDPDDTPNEAPMSVKITYAQVFYDYGKTDVDIPDDLPSLDEDEKDMRMLPNPRIVTPEIRHRAHKLPHRKRIGG